MKSPRDFLLANESATTLAASFKDTRAYYRPKGDYRKGGEGSFPFITPFDGPGRRLLHSPKQKKKKRKKGEKRGKKEKD